MFAKDKYKQDLWNVVLKVVSALVADGGLQARAPDGSLAEATWPAWIKDDYLKIKQNYTLFPIKAVALAFFQVSAEVSRKIRGLSLKKKADDNVEMMDDTSRSNNVDAIVKRKFQ